MPAPKRKPVEPYDGSYAGMVLGLFDDMEEREARAAADERGDLRQHLAAMGYFKREEARLRWKEDLLRRNGTLTETERAEDERQRREADRLLTIAEGEQP